MENEKKDCVPSQNEGEHKREAGAPKVMESAERTFKKARDPKVMDSTATIRKSG